MATFPTFVNFQLFTNKTDINTVSNLTAINGTQSVVLGDQIKQEIECITIPLTVEDDRKFQLFLKEIRGAGKFKIALSDQLEFKPVITPVGTPTVVNINNSAGYSIGDNVITVDENTAIGLGSYIQFSNHNKLYQVFNRTDTTLTITPNLYKAIADDTKVNYTALSGEFRIVNGINGLDQSSTWSYNQYKRYGFTLTEEIQ